MTFVTQVILSDTHFGSTSNFCLEYIETKGTHNLENVDYSFLNRTSAQLGFRMSPSTH